MSNFLCLIKPLTSNGAQVLFLQASLLKLLPEVVLTILNKIPNEQGAPKILDRPIKLQDSFSKCPPFVLHL